MLAPAHAVVVSAPAFGMYYPETYKDLQCMLGSNLEQTASEKRPGWTGARKRTA